MEIASNRAKKIDKVVKNRQSGLTLILEDIHDPHNAAAILRTADAFGIQDIYFVFDREQAYNPKKVGKVSSSSANKWLDFKIYNSIQKSIEKLKAQDYFVIGTALSKQAKNFFKESFNQENIAIIVGNEHRGISDKAIKACDQVVEIPMRGFVQSLNVSVATALLISEITRQRLANDKLNSLGTHQQAQLKANFLKR